MPMICQGHHHQGLSDFDLNMKIEKNISKRYSGWIDDLLHKLCKDMYNVYCTLYNVHCTYIHTFYWKIDRCIWKDIKTHTNIHTSLHTYTQTHMHTFIINIRKLLFLHICANLHAFYLFMRQLVKKVLSTRERPC